MVHGTELLVVSKHQILTLLEQKIQFVIFRKLHDERIEEHEEFVEDELPLNIQKIFSKKTEKTNFEKSTVRCFMR